MDPLDRLEDIHLSDFDGPSKLASWLTCESRVFSDIAAALNLIHTVCLPGLHMARC